MAPQVATHQWWRTVNQESGPSPPSLLPLFFVSFQNFKLPMSNAHLRQRTPSGKHTHFNRSFDHFPLLNSHLILSANVAYLFLLSSKSRKPLEIEKMFCFGFGRLTQCSLNKMPCCVMNAHYKVINLLTSKYLLALPFSPHLENQHKNDLLSMQTTRLFVQLSSQEHTYKMDTRHQK